jgi:Mrp family chromosome partitioning ATPase
VTVPPNSTLLKVSYDAPTPAQAAIGANAFAQAYKDNRNQSVIDQLAPQRKRLMAAGVTPSQGKDATATALQLQHIDNELAALVPAAQDPFTVGPDFTFTANPAANAGAQVVTVAGTPTSPSSPNKIVVLASGLMLGLLLGLLWAWWAARRDHRLYAAYELPEQLNVPILGSIPLRKGSPPALVAGQSRAGQAFARTRNVLLARLPERSGVFTVAGASGRRGGDSVGANLAASFARADLNTILVVADPDSTAPAMLGLPGAPGLVEVLRHGVAVSDVLRAVNGVTGLRVLGPGSHLATEIDDLEGAGVGHLLSTLRGEADVVVVIGPPTSEGAQSQILAGDSDAAVVVVDLGVTRREQVLEAFDQFQSVGTPVPGAVTLPRLAAGPSPLTVAPAGSPAGAAPRRLATTLSGTQTIPATGEPSSVTTTNPRRFPSSTI